MKKEVVICTFCLALTTSVVAVPSGNRGMKEAAAKLLAWAEERGGMILSEILLGKREVNGRTNYDPAVVRDYRQFLQELSSRLTTLQSQTQPAAQEKSAERGSGRGRGRGRRTSDSSTISPSLVLPPDTTLNRLDYSDILGILGDYTKGFVAMVEPLLTPPVTFAFSVQLPLFKREERQDAAERVIALVESSLAKVGKVQD